VDRVYHGSAGRLVAAFVKDGSLTPEERAQLRKLLDEMEV
jgi:predicted transcriptional regulator